MKCAVCFHCNCSLDWGWCGKRSNEATGWIIQGLILWHGNRFSLLQKCSEVKWSEVQCSEGDKNETLWEKFIWAVKWWEVSGWGGSVSTVCVGKNTGNCIQYFLTVVLFTFCTCCILRWLACTVVNCLVCIVVVVLRVLLSSYVYLLYCVCITVLL